MCETNVPSFWTCKDNTCVLFSKSLLKSSTGLPFLLRDVGRLMEIPGRLPSPGIKICKL